MTAQRVKRDTGNNFGLIWIMGYHQTWGRYFPDANGPDPKVDVSSMFVTFKEGISKTEQIEVWPGV